MATETETSHEVGACEHKSTSEAKDPPKVEDALHNLQPKEIPGGSHLSVNKSKEQFEVAGVSHTNSGPDSATSRKRSRAGDTEPSAKRARNDKPADHSPRPQTNASLETLSRPRKRPGGAARISRTEISAVQRRQEERQHAATEAITSSRGTIEAVKQHYNAVPQRGREWRRTDSRIKGLRSFNNWIKSTLIHKFSPDPGHDDGDATTEGETWKDPKKHQRLKVLDIGCGKGGDLGKWAQAPQPVELYVGIDPAEVSIEQAKERFSQMQRGRGGRHQQSFEAIFLAEDAFTYSLGDLNIIREVGFGPGSRWGPGGGFDVVSMMFCMHYAFESEAKAKGMLANVAGSLRKGGRFLGVIPNSDILRENVITFHKAKHAKAQARTEHAKAASRKENEEEEEEEEEGETKEEGDSEERVEWGNSIYRVRFPGATPEDGLFRPPFGWKYSYFMEEAVEEVPEYVVPWEAFRAIAEDYNLELQYRKPFRDIWKEEGRNPVFGPLSERMGVRERNGGELLVSEEEMDAAGFYHAFCFYKV